MPQNYTHTHNSHRLLDFFFFSVTHSFISIFFLSFPSLILFQLSTIVNCSLVYHSHYCCYYYFTIFYIYFFQTITIIIMIIIALRHTHADTNTFSCKHTDTTTSANKKNENKIQKICALTNNSECAAHFSKVHSLATCATHGMH